MTEGTFSVTATLPEGLRWHEGELWLSDVVERRVVSFDGDGRRTPRAFVVGQPSGLGWTPAGELLVASMIDQRLVSPSGERPRVLASLAGAAAGAINDMLVDPRGRAYIGSLGYDPLFEIFEDGFDARARRATLSMVAPDGRVSVVADDLACPNGIAVTPDGSVLVVAESYGARLTAFDVGADGSLANRRVFADLPDAQIPDGICMDRDGAVWTALTTSNRVARIADGGRLLDEIVIEGRIVIDCALGGPDGRTLFVSTTDRRPDIWTTGEVRGEVRTWRVDVPGTA